MPLIERFVKVAAPAPSVVAVTVPPSVPAPLATLAVTVTPGWLTPLPPASRSWTTGCCAKAIVFCALADGWTVSVSWEALPAERVIPAEVTGVSAPDVNCRV